MGVGLSYLDAEDVVSFSSAYKGTPNDSAPRKISINSNVPL